MIYFLLPNVNITIYKHIDCLFSSTPPEIAISNSLSHYLFEIKNKIKQYENDWNDYKKYTNPYEFINTIIPGKNKCVSKYKPLSRSYFKMVEILHFLMYSLREPSCENGFSEEDGETFDHSVNLKSTAPIRTFHLAEGPGGFIEATANLRNNPADQYYGMTILDDAENCKIYSLPEIQEKGMNVPGWKKTESFLRCHPNIILEHGADGTGNILSLENFLYCSTKYGGSMDFITADGGFDFSVDFNNQETNIAGLLFAQVCYALCLQKHGGHFVLKIFDCFMDHTVDILYILSSFYEKVYITKPQTSRYANSEKYIVCKNFLVTNCDTHKPSNEGEYDRMLEIAILSNVSSKILKPSYNAIFPFLKDAFQKMLSQNTLDNSSNISYICRFLKIHVPIHYVYRLEEYNAIFGQQQIENIYQTMILIEQCGERANSKHWSMHKPSKEFITSENLMESDEGGCSNLRSHRGGSAFSRCSKKLGNANDSGASKDIDTAQAKTNQRWSREHIEDNHVVDTIDCNMDYYNDGSSSSLAFCNRGGITMSHPKIENLVRTNIQKCIQWCMKHNIAYYNYTD